MKFSTFALVASAALVAAAPAPLVEEVSTVVEEVTSFFEVTVTVTGVEPTGEATTTTVAEELTTTVAEYPEYSEYPEYPEEEEEEEEETTEVETVTDYPTLAIPTVTLSSTNYPILNSTIVAPTYTINGTNPIVTATHPAPTSTDEVPPPSEGAASVGRTVGLGAAAAGVFALVAGLL